MKLEHVNLSLDCGATTHIMNAESELVSLEKNFSPKTIILNYLMAQEPTMWQWIRETTKLYFQTLMEIFMTYIFRMLFMLQAINRTFSLSKQQLKEVP